MKFRMKNVLVIVMAVWATVGPHALFGQRKSGAEVLARCERNYQGIADYTVDLQADLDMDRVRVPRMQATMYFKAPDKVHFQSPNFALLPREGFGVPVTTLIERYDATYKGEEVIEGVTADRVHLVAKDPAARLQQLYVWVDQSNATIKKMETVPYQGRSVSMRFFYKKQDDRYWLPDTMNVRLTVPQPDSLAEGRDTEAARPGEMRDVRRGLRSGTITVTYSNYRINTGLSDDLFKQPERER